MRSGMTADDRVAQALGAVIELDGVCRHYRVGETTVSALEDISLSVQAGEFVVILGPSGSGKTTLLNMIGALDSPTSGRAMIGGHDVTSASRGQLFRFRRETVAFIFQTFNLFPGLTALENVEFGLAVARRGGGSAEAIATLERVGLGSRLDHFPDELSGGEQQRVAIARAVATGSPVLLADEPTGELDFHTGAEILELLREQACGGRCVVVVTHNREIARIANRVIELSGGSVLADGPPPNGQPADVSELRW
jgi:putative ABC transport system ATP-binding protein